MAQRVDPGRRRLLATTVMVALGAPVLASCTSGGDAGGSGDPQDPDTGVRADVAAQERALVDAYEATLAVHPSLAARLAPLRDQHVEHLRAVSGQQTPDPPAGGSATADPVPSSPRTAVKALRRAERRAGRSRADSCEAATDAGLARLLALIAASEASHAVVLRGDA